MTQISHTGQNAGEAVVPAGRPGAAPQTSAAEQRSGSKPARRQFISFYFYKLMPEFRRLPQEQQAAMLDEFAALVERNDRRKDAAARLQLCRHAPDVDIMFWKISYELERLQDFRRHQPPAHRRLPEISVHVSGADQSAARTLTKSSPATIRVRTQHRTRPVQIHICVPIC